MSLFRSLRILRTVSIVLIFSHLLQIIFPSGAYALGGGPSTPEVSSFQPAGVNDLVDLSTGDFSYNIPLMDIEGYPLNLSYSSDITMDQEASSVGLGWNLNVGMVTRSMRGLPDDFKGDEVKHEFNVRPNKTIGISGDFSKEIFGFGLGGPGLNLGIFRNNYKGLGYEVGLTPAISAGDKGKGALTASLGLNFNSQNGISIQPSLSFERELKKLEASEANWEIGIGSSFNSRAGLQALNIMGGSEAKDIEIDGLEGLHNLSNNGGSSISFATPTYTPKLNLPFSNNGFTFTATVGGALFGLHNNFDLKGYYSEQKLASNRERVPAFGFLHAEETTNRDRALLDFNREKEGSFIKEATPHLPLTQMTFDIFSVSGQGIGGSYRAFRSDVGTVYDSYMFNGGFTGSLGGEIGLPALLHGGVDVKASGTKSTSGKWKNDNDLSEVAKFRSSEELVAGEQSQEAQALYEPFYFKQIGEKTESDQEFFTSIGNESALRPSLTTPTPTSSRTIATNSFRSKEGNLHSSNTYYRKNRAKRNQSFSFLTADEASKIGMDKDIPHFDMNVAPTFSGQVAQPNTHLQRVSAMRKGHHISEISVTRDDGARYIYGLPAYNAVQHEVSFNVSPSTEGGISNNTQDCSTGLTSYRAKGSGVSDADNSIENKRGLDRYYHKTSLPPYAYAYHLTSMVYPDYVDVTGDGISDDDLGNWVRFNYTQLHGNDPENDHYEGFYRWRTPVPKDRASFNEGLKSDPRDDKGSYIYGEKEIWQVHSIESRNFIAQFVYGDRNDAFDIAGENGGVSNRRRMRRLMRVELYSKRDKIANPTEAVPIKTAHFLYGYQLCKEVANGRSAFNNGAPSPNEGKLSLRYLMFSYEDSKKGLESPYEFKYGEGIHNPNYDMRAYDRWGTYKPQDCALPNGDFPYTDQTAPDPAKPNERLVDDYAQAWLLKEIHTPSGGQIKIDYESDDYAYVQNREAMQMFFLKGFTTLADINTGNPNLTDNLFTSSGGILFPNYTNRNVAVFDLTAPADTREEFYEKYLKGIGELYFRMLVNLNGSGASDYVPGYTEIDDYGLIDNPSTGEKQGWIAFKNVGIKDNGNGAAVHPISKAAWNFIRLNNPDLMYPGVYPDGTSESNVLGLMGFAMDMKNLFQGPNKTLRSRGFANRADADKSWIRLKCPDGMKHGGGVRVKQIAMEDMWDVMAGNGAKRAIYGQTYTYTTTNAKGESISSGVAAYEPVIGGDENPFRTPKYFDKKNLLAPDDEHYIEYPLGESFFPAPTVVYSKVQVSDLPPPGQTQAETGYVQHEFYTAKDFPTITEHTDLDMQDHKTNPLIDLFQVYTAEFVTASQGYVVKLNDMHGKPKAQWIYAKDQNEPISGQEFFYRSKKPYNALQVNELDNENVEIIKANGTKTTGTVGKDIEMVLDSREQETETTGFIGQGNVDAFLAAIFPALIGTFIPQPVIEKTRFRSLVATKVVHTYGLLDYVMTHDLSSRVKTTNRAYDAETGEVLLTETSNEFKDPIFNFTYPAHWAYPGMGCATANLNAKWTSSNLSSLINTGILFPGDELLLRDANTIEKAWVLNSAYIMDREGAQVDPNTNYEEIRIIRSGHRNQQFIPMGSLMSKEEPALNGNWSDIDKVLDAGATEFSDEWNFNCLDYCINPGDDINPYLRGIRGIWQAKRSHLFQNDRDESYAGIRENGAYTQFDPFWEVSNGRFTADPSGWTWTEEISVFSPYGYDRESRDALNRYSSSQYSYQHQLPIAIASNASYQDMANANFEIDEEHNTCFNPHIDFRRGRGGIAIAGSDAYAHSGLRSLQVSGSESVEADHFLRDITSPCLAESGGAAAPSGQGSFALANQVGSGYQVKDCDCIESFAPRAGEKMVANVWVSDPDLCQAGLVFDFPHLEMRILLNDQISISAELKRGKIIEGWQRLEYIFTIPASANPADKFTIQLHNTSPDPSNQSYFDDFRIHPFLSGMTSYVYHPESLRLMAQGDDRNHMTFYEYDEEGKLIRVKKETERGVMTLQTNRNNTHK
ncbi:MAG: hypothetical protein AAF696_12935 [Bacteroidota bacterium]